MQSGTYLRTNQLLLQGFSRVWCVWNRNRRFEKVVSWIAHLNIMLNHQPAFLPLQVQNHDDDYGGGGKSSLLPEQSPDDVVDGCYGLSMHTTLQFYVDAKMMFLKYHVADVIMMIRVLMIVLMVCLCTYYTKRTIEWCL